jgi:hypothetical protein
MLTLIFRGDGSPLLTVTAINIKARTAEFSATLTF